MKILLSKSMLLMTAMLSAIDVHAYDFCETNEDGVMIYYNVVSENDKTCEVTAMEERHSWYEKDTLFDYVGDIVIPSSANGFQVTRIGNNAFSCCKKMTSLTLPNTIMSIENGICYSCTGLTSLEIPNSVTTIGPTAFYGCSGLTSIDIPNSVTTIKSLAFEHCTGLKSVSLPNSITKIDNYTFNYCI